MENLWREVLNEIEIEISKPIFLTFLKPTTLLSLVDSIATINSPTQITSEYIEKRYYFLIKKILGKKTGQDVSLVFTSEVRAGSKIGVIPGPLFAASIKSEIQKRPPRIRVDYTFDSMAVSESNQLAYTAALTVATNPGTKYNPLFLYGTVGVGKTHLMNAIANKSFAENENLNVTYLTTEEFTNEVVEAIRDKTTNQMRKKFRNVNILLLDDVQFLTGKDRMQEELFHTFNTLIDKGRQVVLSSDRPPQDLRKIETRLASRFEGGLSVDIGTPDFELRTAILLIKSKKYGLSLSYDAAKAAAERIEDTRALEGFLLRVVSARQGMSGDEVSAEDIMPILGKTRPASGSLRPDDVIKTICTIYDIKPTQLKGVKRDSYLIKPRHMCMFILKEETSLTFVEIGNLIGGRDHTTVMHAVGKIKDKILLSPKTKEEILFIKKRIKEELL